MKNNLYKIRLGLLQARIAIGGLTMDDSYPKDPDPKNWRTINGSKVHLTKGKIDGGAGKKFNGNKWKGKQHHIFTPSASKEYKPEEGKEFHPEYKSYLDKIEQVIAQSKKGKGKPAFYQSKIDKIEKILEEKEKAGYKYTFAKAHAATIPTETTGSSEGKITAAMLNKAFYWDYAWKLLSYGMNNLLSMEINKIDTGKNIDDFVKSYASYATGKHSQTIFDNVKQSIDLYKKGEIDKHVLQNVLAHLVGEKKPLIELKTSSKTGASSPTPLKGSGNTTKASGKKVTAEMLNNVFKKDYAWSMSPPAQKLLVSTEINKIDAGKSIDKTLNFYNTEGVPKGVTDKVKQSIDLYKKGEIDKHVLQNILTHLIDLANPWKDIKASPMLSLESQPNFPAVAKKKTPLGVLPKIPGFKTPEGTYGLMIMKPLSDGTPIEKIAKEFEAKYGKPQVDKLSSSEKKAIKRYTDGSSHLRDFLVYGKTDSAYKDLYYKDGMTAAAIQNTVDEISKGLKQMKHPPIWVKRRASIKDWATPQNLHPTEKQLEEMMNNGTIFENKAFLSSTPHIKGTYGDGFLVRNIFLPEKATAGYIPSTSQYENEKEVLIDKGSKTRIIKIEKIDGIIHTYEEVVV